MINGLLIVGPEYLWIKDDELQLFMYIKDSM